ncbi:hypothetical protein KUTeg_024679 [Tegillarca granosa]|uniref:alpha-L-fucosidase n=1 Tax=Tegillarca granosa TaxID=220873 RepID=A0ABQ9DY19_TEGGR|nr:hypothetical protein KUTeg_024679 [Tegillarca granosa]
MAAFLFKIGAPEQTRDERNVESKHGYVHEMFENIKDKPKNHSQGTLHKYQPNWKSLESRPLPSWYDDGKIGIFLHWGVYSVPSFVDVGNKGLGEWFWWYWKGRVTNGTTEGSNRARKNKESATKFMKENYPPGFEYTDFAPHFQAEFFEPDKWAELFHASGARYIVLTSKHHEGFPLWPSKWSWNWNAMDNGPHRDLVGNKSYNFVKILHIGDLAASVRKKGIKFGLYHSLYEWFNPFYLQDKNNNFTTQIFLKEKLTPELTDLVMRYKPDLVWTDGDWEAPSTYWNCTHFLSWLYNESPVKDTVVTNDRWGLDIRCKHGGFLTCDDRWVPDKQEKRKWENCMTIDKDSWGYRRNANIQDYYNMDELIQILVQTVSKGGNLLMNIGPTADGRIVPLFQERLTQLGQWLRVNGEAIYGTTPWTYEKDSSAEGVWYTSKQIQGQTVEWNGIIKLSALANFIDKNTKVTWIGYGEKIEWQSKDGLEIKIPRLYPHEMPCEWAWTFKIEKS